MNAKRKILATGAALSLLVVGALTATSASATQSEECIPDPGQPYIAPKYATEYEFTRDVYKTKYEYIKEVKGKIQFDADPRGGHVNWKPVIFDPKTFDWEVWSGGSTKWSFDDVEVLESGPHNAVQATWTSDLGIDYRKLTTAYRYVPTGKTDEVKIDTEFKWSEETSLDGWTATGKERSGEGLTRLIDPGQEEIPPTLCPGVDFTHDPEVACGTASVSVMVADVPATWYYGAKILVDGVEADSVLTQGPGTDTATLKFEEDAGDGEVTVRYFVHASTEWDLVPADLNYQATWPEVGDAFREFTVDTDCLAPEEPEEPVVPEAPAARATVSQPSFTG